MNGLTEDKNKYFMDISQEAIGKLKNFEELTINYSAEETNFLRFNEAKTRQAITVTQGTLNLAFTENLRSLNYKIQLSGIKETDSKRMEEAINFCRDKVKSLPQDPFILPIENNGTSTENFKGNLPDIEKLPQKLFEITKGLDFAGCLSMGEIIRANINSKGQAHWFSTENFQVDYSLYTDKQKAVKGLYAGSDWGDSNFAMSLEESISQLEKLKITSKSLPRGKYKVYLAPDAVSEIIDMFSWGGVSYSSLMRGNSALKLLHSGEKEFNQEFNLSEDYSLGLNTRFNEKGETAPENLNLIEKGKLKNLLVSSRTAKEYNVVSNGATSFEGLRSTKINSGRLRKEKILSNLDQGIYISNLHYLNWSDVQSGRFTGMTRFACFYVENGRIVAPIEDLRFDETIYNVFGPNLNEISNFCEVIPNVGSYGMRSLGGKSVPGMIVKDFNFTL